jgi:hypothetical protein
MLGPFDEDFEGDVVGPAVVGLFVGDLVVLGLFEGDVLGDVLGEPDGL